MGTRSRALDWRHWILVVVLVLVPGSLLLVALAAWWHSRAALDAAE